MNVAELYQSVAQLGFEDSLEDESSFYNAANRAILQVNKIRPAIGYCNINHKPLKNLLKESTFIPIEKEEDLIFEATNAKSFYFEADGNGLAYIEKQNSDNGWEIIGEYALESASRDFVAYKDFIKDGSSFVEGEVRIRFTGEYLYSVKNVALYGQLYSADTADIPEYSAYTRYDISQLVDDFMVLCSPPIKQEETNTILNQHYEVEGNSVILLPCDTKGYFKVLYEKEPQRLVDGSDVENDTTEIELDAELCSLLPTLIASYVWAEDEPEKAEYYLSLYRERVSLIVSAATDLKPVTIKNIYGW